MTMLGVTTVAGIAALCLSATANRQLLRQVGDDLHRFYAVPVEEFITKARHLSVLKDDATMLDGYYREGEPLRLGLVIPRRTHPPAGITRHSRLASA